MAGARRGWLGRDPHDAQLHHNDGASLIAMACRHQGLVLLSEWGLKDYLAHGELVPIMLEQTVSVGRGGEAGIYLLYLQTRYRTPKVAVAVEFLVSRLGGSE